MFLFAKALFLNLQKFFFFVVCYWFFWPFCTWLATTVGDQRPRHQVLGVGVAKVWLFLCESSFFLSCKGSVLFITIIFCFFAAGSFGPLTPGCPPQSATGDPGIRSLVWGLQKFLLIAKVPFCLQKFFLFLQPVFLYLVTQNHLVP